MAVRAWTWPRWPQIHGGLTMGLLTPEEVAKELAMSLSWVYANKHRIGFVQLGSAVRFDKDAVEGYAARCRRGPQLNEERQWDSRSPNGRIAARGSSAKRSTVAALSELFAQREKQGSTH